MKMYRMKNMAFVGVVALVAVAAWMLASLCIPTFRYSATDRQLYTIRHQELRDNNTLYTDLFLQSIKANNGYLVLGTSESGSVTGGNYFDFLNADTALDVRFSVVAGAGRTACTHFPLICGNDNVENLKVIYYVNPAYWCNKLASSNEDYFMRYTSYAAMWSAGVGGDKYVEEVIRANRRNVTMSDRSADFLAFYFDKIRRKYYQDLVFAIDSMEFKKTLNFVKPQSDVLKSVSSALPDSSEYNYTYNVSGAFDINSYSLNVNTESPYRYDELRAMIHLCRERKVDIVFVVGPYNHIAFSNANSSELASMQSVCKKILRLLDEEGAAYIDASDISSVPGTFSDWQHHSNYGAYLLYQKIKNYVVEKENR